MDYEKLLDKAKKDMPQKVEKSERFVVPPVKGHIQGNSTIISNFSQIASYLRRDPEHLLKYILRELATPGEIKKGSILIRSKISSVRINEKIEKYVQEFVLCKECSKPDTQLLKQDKITFMKCLACGAHYPIREIK